MSSIMKLNAIYPFNHDVNLPPCYEAPQDDFSPTGKIVVVDRSASMECKEQEFKLALSMLSRGLAGLKQVPVVPRPSGSTNLIGKVKKIVESGLGEQELIIITDGFDNAHDINEFQVGVAETGEPQIIKVDRDNYSTTDAYLRARQSAILDYLGFIGAKVHLIGIGKEVSDLLSMAGRHRMRVAHIRQGATTSEVVAVIDAALSTDPDAALRREDFASAEAFEAEAERRVITIDRIGCRPAPTDDQVQEIQRTAAMVHVGDDRFTEESFKEAFATAETAAPIAEYARQYTRGVVLWLMAQSIEKGFIPGAAIGGARAKIFAEPEGGNAQWRVNQLLHQLKVAGMFTAKKLDTVLLELEGRSRNFKKVECYQTSSAVAHLVDTLKSDANWATPTSQLVRAGKRARNSP